MNRSLDGFIFMKQRVILIPVILVFPNSEGQRQGRNVDRHLRNKDRWLYSFAVILTNHE